MPGTNGRPWFFRHGPLLLVVLSAVALRMLGLRHGLGWHVDESSIIGDITNLSWDNLKPRGFVYGGLLYYIPWFVARLGLHPADFKDWLVLARSLSAFYGCLAVLLTYALARALDRSRGIALTAAVLLAFNPLHIQLSHFYLSDGLVTTAGLAVLLLTVLYLRSERPRDLLFAALMLGIALACKVSALTLMLPLCAAMLLVQIKKRRLPRREFLWWGAALVLVALTACVLQPYALLDYSRFLSDVRGQIEMVSGRGRAPWNNQYIGTAAYLYPLQHVLRYTMSWPVLCMALLGLAAACFKQLKRFNAAEFVLLLWLLCSFAVVGKYEVKFARYYLPFFPLLLFFAADACRLWAAPPLSRVQQRLQAAALSILAVWGACCGLAFARIYTEPHVFVSASEWICDSIVPESTILQINWDPELPQCAHLARVPHYRMEVPEWRLDLYEMPQNEKALRQLSEQLSQGDFLVFPTSRAFRGVLQVPEMYPVSAPLLRLLTTGKIGYRLHSSFKVRPRLGPLVFNDDLADESFVIHDHPKVLFFENRERFDAETIQERVRHADDFAPLPSLGEVLSMNWE